MIAVVQTWLMLSSYDFNFVFDDTIKLWLWRRLYYQASTWTILMLSSFNFDFNFDNSIKLWLRLQLQYCKMGLRTKNIIKMVMRWKNQCIMITIVAWSCAWNAGISVSLIMKITWLNLTERDWHKLEQGKNWINIEQLLITLVSISITCVVS